ncbi:MAG: YceI family protein [Chitinophagales bacterium]|nr:YceI family protein [Chitinophagales bacterium]
MKVFQLIIWCTAISLVFSTCKNAPESDEAITSEAKEVTEQSSDVTFKVDPAASKVEFIGTKVSGYHSGYVQIKNGELQVKDGNITGGNFVMDMNSITISGPKNSDEEGNMKLAGHLKSPDFFDVEKNPEGVFEITSVKPFSGNVTEENEANQEEFNKYKVANPTHTISGNLTLKGITKNIEFPARISMTGDAIDALARFNIDRSLWDITYPGKPDDLIRNDINLGIELIAAK